MTTVFSLILGSVVGVSLGLTGGGGSLLAVPLLVYGLGLKAQDAVALSLATVGVVALVGFLQRLRSGHTDVRAGLLVAVTGMVLAPAGAWASRQLDEAILLAAFAVLMVVVAALMWRQASTRPDASRAVRAFMEPFTGREDGAACRFDPKAGRLHMTSRCALALAGVGCVAGFLSGLFGVGGGFIIVPALVFAARIDVFRAVGTSLLIIALVSASGTAAHLSEEVSIPLQQGLLFVLGGLVGLQLGSLLAYQLSGPRLQKLFAAAIVGVAIFVTINSLVV